VKLRLITLAVLICLFDNTYAAESLPISLNAAKAPGSTSWTDPATFTYVSNKKGADHYSINAALSGNIWNSKKQPIQTQVSAWIAKNTSLDKEQDKYGIDINTLWVIPNNNLIFNIGLEEDNIGNSKGSSIQIYDQFAKKDWNLGSCGDSLDKGCTYWDFTLGLYNHDINQTNDSTGEGSVAGAKAILKITSNPFSVDHSLNPLKFEFFAQTQNEFSASGDRKKENRELIKAKIIWSFYKSNESPAYKPAIGLEWVDGEDLFTGLPDQNYTQLNVMLQF
jgi:hypothetical protein